MIAFQKQSLALFMPTGHENVLQTPIVSSLIGVFYLFSASFGQTAVT